MNAQRMNRFEIDPDLTPDTKLYRYITIEQFVSFVENEQIHLSNINLWDDKWEAINSKLPTVNEKGEYVRSLSTFHDLTYGQCWSSIPDSDAMWRIYSPNKTGIQIATSVKKFKTIEGVNRWCLGKVIYFKEIEETFEKSKSHKSPFIDALFKRLAFNHESEVRFLTNGNFLTPHNFKKQNFIGLPIKPSEFIEEVTIDPRAGEWYLDTITKYCERVGLGISPIKSDLYDPNPQSKIGWVKKWVNKK